MKWWTRLLVAALVLVLVAGMGVPVAAERTYSPEQEAKVGAEAAAEIAKEYKTWTGDEATAQLARVQAMVDRIAPATSRPEVKYTVTLLDDDDVNAFTIPGGYVYVTRGLLKDVQSDSELAGVLAHEIAHNCTFDALRQVERGQKLSIGMLVAALATVVAGGRDDRVFAVLQAGELVSRGVLSHYSIQVERQADLNAMRFLVRAGINPVGLLTFMERLAARDRAKGDVSLGIFQSHPASRERVTYLTGALLDSGIDLNRRAVTKWDPPVIKVVGGGNGQPEVVALELWGTELLRFDSAPAGQDIAARGAAMTDALTHALAEGAQDWEFKAAPAGDGSWAVLWSGTPLLRVYDFDARVAGVSVEATAQSVVLGLRRALLKEYVSMLYQ